MIAALALVAGACASGGGPANAGPSWDEWLPGDLHVHPMGHGDVDIPDMVRFAAEAERIGLRWWFATDHGAYMGCPPKGVIGAASCTLLRRYDPAEGRRRWDAARGLAESESRARNMYIMMGQEMGNSAVVTGERRLTGGRGHIVSLEQSGYMDDPMPPAHRCGMECIDQIRAQGPGAFGFIAHPSRGGSDWPEFETLFDRLPSPGGPIAGFEILDGTHTATRRDRELWDAYLLDGRKIWVIGVGEMHYLDVAKGVAWGERARTYAFLPGLESVPEGYDAATGGRQIKDALRAGSMIATNGPVATLRVRGTDLGGTVDVSPGDRVTVLVFWKTELLATRTELLPVELRVIFKYRDEAGGDADGSRTIELTEEQRRTGSYALSLMMPDGFVGGFVRLEARSDQRLPFQVKEAIEGDVEIGQPRTAFTNPIFLS